MDAEQRKNAFDELYVLGFIAGLCNQEPRDELLLEVMLLYLREAQAQRCERDRASRRMRERTADPIDRVWPDAVDGRMTRDE